MSSEDDSDSNNDAIQLSDYAWETWLTQQREETQRRLYGRDDFETISVGNDDDDNDSLPSISTHYSSSTNTSRNGHFVFADAPVPPFIAGARKTLSMLFEDSRWHVPEGREFVLKVLLQHPALAAEAFIDADGELRKPLSHLISARANLEMIQTVYNMRPEAICEPQGYINDLPLHDACWYGSNPDVVQFIAMEYPEALTILNDSRRLPIHDAIRSSRISANNIRLTSSETIRFLLEMYPGSIKIRDNDGKSIIESALYYGYDPELLLFMIQFLPSSVLNSFQCSGGYYTLDLPRAQAIHNIFAHVKSFRCDPPSWTSDGFVYLMHSLANDTSLESMEMLSFPATFNPDVRGGFLYFLENNQTLQHLSIDIRNANLVHNQTCLQILATALATQNSKSNLQKLQLGRMVIVDRHSLTNFLLHARAPTKELVFEQVTIRLSMGALYRTSLLGENAVVGRISNVVFNNCPMDQEALEEIFELLAFMPSLRQLQMDFNPSAPGSSTISDLNMTIPLMNLLEHNTLQKIELSPIYSFDLLQLVDVLKRNTSLETLQSASHALKANALHEILQHNTTLSNCGLEPAGRHDTIRDKAIYLLRLNMVGRRRIRDNITKLQFLEIILKANQAESLKLPIQRFNVVHGLLRESPSFWSAPGSNSAVD